MVRLPYPRGGKGVSRKPFRKAASLGSPGGGRAIAYLEAGLSGLRIAPAALATAALALPVAVRAAGGEVQFGWFGWAGVLALVGVGGLAGATYKSAVDLTAVWVTPDRMLFISFGSTFLAAILLFLGVSASLDPNQPSD